MWYVEHNNWLLCLRGSFVFCQTSPVNAGALEDSDQEDHVEIMDSEESPEETSYLPTIPESDSSVPSFYSDILK